MFGGQVSPGLRNRARDMLEIPRFVLGAKREGEKCSRSGSKQGSAFFFERFLKNTETKPQGSVLRTQVCVLCDASGDAVRATAAWTKSDGLTQRGFCQAGLVSELVAQDVRIFKLGRALQLFFSLSSSSRLRVNAPRDSGYDCLSTVESPQDLQLPHPGLRGVHFCGAAPQAQGGSKASTFGDFR